MLLIRRRLISVNHQKRAKNFQAQLKNLQVKLENLRVERRRLAKMEARFDRAESALRREHEALVDQEIDASSEETTPDEVFIELNRKLDDLFLRVIKFMIRRRRHMRVHIRVIIRSRKMMRRKLYRFCRVDMKRMRDGGT